MIFSAKVKMVGKRDRSYVDEETGKLKKRLYANISQDHGSIIHSLYVDFRRCFNMLEEDKEYIIDFIDGKSKEGLYFKVVGATLIE